MSVALTPYELLAEQEQKTAYVSGLPSDQDVKEKWSGVQFRLNGMDLLVPLSEVVEIADIPAVAKVPGVKFWVKGIANMRGNLLPVLDLNGFLFNKSTKVDAQSRLLVLHQDDVYAGLIVERVAGMKHFWVEERTSNLPEVSSEFGPYIKGSFKRMSEHLPVFSMASLAKTDAFLEVAV